MPVGLTRGLLAATGRQMNRTYILALTASALCSLSCSVAAFAEDADQPPVVIVTGQGLSQTPGTPAYGVQVVDREQLLRSASGRIEEGLVQVAGVQQFRRSDSRSSNPSAQGVTLRALGGNATSRALVLLDGVPMADPFFGYIPFSAISPDQLSAARVTRGGGTGAFGAGAVAGTIELESADREQLDLFSGGAFVNDRGETEVSASLAPRLGNGFAVLSGRWDRGKGFFTTPVTQRVPATARARYDSWSVGLRGVAPLAEDVELQVRGLAFDDRRTLRFAGADSRSTGQDASLRLVGRGAWQFDLLGYVQARDFGNVVISATSFRKTLDQRRTPSTGLGGKFEVRPPVGPDHVLRLGTDLRIADGELQEDAYGAGGVTARRRAGGRTSDLGFYIENDWTLGALVLTGGARLDRWSIADGMFRETNAAGVVTIDNRFADRADWQASFRGGAVWHVTPELAVRGAAYSGLRQPTLNELYRPFVVFPITTRANAALRNEELRGFEAGFDIAPLPGVSLGLTAFDNRIDHAIANVTIGTNLRERRNVDAVTSRGLELSAKAKYRSFDIVASLAWTDAEVQSGMGPAEELNGRRPAQTPRLAAFAGLTWRPATGWSVTANVRHTGAQFEDDLEKDLLPAATTVDALVEIPLGAASLVLRGENLLDEAIVTRKSGSSLDLGTPRTIWAGIRVGL